MIDFKSYETHFAQWWFYKGHQLNQCMPHNFEASTDRLRNQKDKTNFTQWCKLKETTPTEQCLSYVFGNARYNWILEEVKVDW